MRIGRFAELSRHETGGNLPDTTKYDEWRSFASARIADMFNHDARAGA